MLKYGQFHINPPLTLAVRIRVLSVGKLWRWSPSAGKFYKIKIQIEYVFKGMIVDQVFEISFCKLFFDILFFLPFL